MKQQLLVATHNQGKVAEFADMLGELDVAWLSLDDVGITVDVAETGETFQENAELKARFYAHQSGMLTLADDSGLEVAALQGQPGVRTARYGGANLSHAERYGLLLHNLREVAWEDRAAQFCCVIALADPTAVLGTAVGICPGIIATTPAGTGGFGYDPVFFLPERGVTMAQLPPGVKHQISHRGRALQNILPLLRQTLAA